jgi:enhancing lycopene biosynthesis protein 2
MMSKKRIGVVLSGSGVQDGSEIHEAVLTLLALDRAGAEAVCMAPDRDQAGVVDHQTGKVVKETRNMLTEGARIARGNIRNMADVDPGTLDGVILPGGYGAAKNLSTFAADGADAKVDPDVRKLLTALRQKGKPIAVLCISPVVVAALFGSEIHPEVTIGDDAGTAAALEAMGAKHRKAAATEVVVDAKHKIVSTPCYMYDSRVSEVAEGIEKAVKELLALA